MYLIGQGHEHLGPGTSMVQRINWTQAEEDQGRGMGCACSEKRAGMGLFDSGLDISGWSWPEYALAGVGAYMVMSTVFTTRRAVGRVRAIPGDRRKRKAAAYRAKAAELSKK